MLVPSAVPIFIFSTLNFRKSMKWNICFAFNIIVIAFVRNENTCDCGFKSTYILSGWLYYTKNIYISIYMAWKICYCFATVPKCHIQSFLYVQILFFSSFSSPQSTQSLWSSWKLQIFFFMIFNGILCCVKCWMHVNVCGR